MLSYVHFAVLFLIFSSASCATKTISIKSSEGATVSLAKFEDLGKDEKVLGKVPLEVPLESIVGRAIRVSKDGRQTAIWLVAEASGERTTLNIDLPESKADGIGAKSNARPLNQVLRLTLSAFKELGRGRFDEAKQLAMKAGEMAPDAAVPQAIIGVSLAKSGDTAGARAALLKAKALDPDDPNIPSLMSALGVK